MRVMNTTRLLTAAATAMLISGCGSSARTGSFRTADGSCQVHQSALPSTAYTGGVNGDTEAVMAMMGSYTAHGTQPYCDRQPATATDRVWIRLYVHLGGNTHNVREPAAE